MKKTKLINSEISYEIAKMGHTNSFVIADSGLPIPREVKCIDLALTKNIPSFIDVLITVIDELFIEEITIAIEMKTHNVELYNKTIETIKELETKQGNKIRINEVEHHEFKNMNKKARCIVRTGEYTPYANIILNSGVVF